MKDATKTCEGCPRLKVKVDDRGGKRENCTILTQKGFDAYRLSRYCPFKELQEG